jgi:hypothetical protein
MLYPALAGRANYVAPWGLEVIKGRLQELLKWKFINRLPEKEKAVTD